MTEASTSSHADDAPVRSVRRALAILRAFGPADRSLPLGEIARRAELDKATARRLLRTLIGENVIEQHGQTKEYSLGLGALALTAGANAADEMRRQARPVLADIAQLTGACTALLVPHAEGAVCIEALPGDKQLRALWTVGQRMPLHAGAGARVLMAHLPLPQRLAALAGPLPMPPPAEPVDPFELGAELETIRQRGWAVGRDEPCEGAASAALPVRNEIGEVIAVLCIAGPAAEVLDDGRPRSLEVLRSKVRDLERRFGAAHAGP